MEDFKKNLVSQVEREHFCDDCMSLVKAYKRVCAIVAVVAMSPAMLNANQPVKALPIDAERLTEILATPNQEKEVSTINFHQAQEEQKKNPHLPGGFAYLNVQEVIPMKLDGTSARIVFAKLDKSKYAAPNEVDVIFYIPHNFKDSNKNHYLPEIIGLVYHNLPDGKDYLSVQTVRYAYRSDEDYKPVAAIFGDYRIDDVSAQYLLDFRTNDTKWKNYTEIPIEFTESPDPMPPKIIDLTR
jgi:hypothetical protein